MTYPHLASLRRKGLRNGNWAQLSSTERALYQCGLWVAKARGAISNASLKTILQRVCLRLLRMSGGDILTAGRKRASIMWHVFDKADAFEWAPQVAEWLHEANYIWYLGILVVNP